MIAVTAPSDYIDTDNFDEVLEFARKKIDVDKELSINHDDRGKKVVFVHPEYTINMRREPHTT